MGLWRMRRRRCRRDEEDEEEKEEDEEEEEEVDNDVEAETRFAQMSANGYIAIRWYQQYSQGTKFRISEK